MLGLFQAQVDLVGLPDIPGLAVGFESCAAAFFELIFVTIAEASTVEPDEDGSSLGTFQGRPEIEDVALVFRVIFDVALGCGGCGVTMGDHGEEEDETERGHLWNRRDW